MLLASERAGRGVRGTHCDFCGSPSAQTGKFHQSVWPSGRRWLRGPAATLTELS
jgi:hypothetical protein